MTVSEYLMEEINKRRKKGIEPEVIKLHPDDVRELKEEVNYIRAGSYAAREVDKFAGIPVHETESVGRVDIDRECVICKSDKVWHDRKEIWVCPFCEL